MEDRIIEEDIEEILRMKIITEKEVGVGLEKDHIWTIIVEGERGVVVIVDQGQNQKANTNRDRISCHKCREYDHFAKDCPTTKEEREIEQIQQMFNLDEEQTSLKTGYK